MEKKNNFFVISGVVLLVIIILVLVVTLSKPVERTPENQVRPDSGSQSGEIIPGEDEGDLNLDENLGEEADLSQEEELEEPTIVYDYSPSDLDGIPLMSAEERALLNITSNTPIYVVNRNAEGTPTRFRYLESMEDVEWVKNRINPVVEEVQE